MSTLDRIGDDLALGVGIDQLEAAVGVKGRPNIETMLCLEIPQTLSGQLHMDEATTTNWTKQCFVEVKGTLEELPCTDIRSSTMSLTTLILCQIVLKYMI